MNQAPNTESTNPLLLLFLNALSIVPAAIIYHNMRMLYDDLREWGVLTDDVLILEIWVLLALLFQILFVYKNTASNRLKLLPGLGFSTFSILCFLFFGLAPLRMTIIRIESQWKNLEITTYKDEVLRQEINEESCSQDLGPYIAKDKDLILTMVERQPNYREQMLTAFTHYVALTEQGVDIEQIKALRNGEQLLLSAFIASFNPNPWRDLSWLDSTAFEYKEQHLVLIPDVEIQQIAQQWIGEADSLDRADIELLVAALSYAPSLVSKEELQRVQALWASQFVGIQPLITQSLVLGQEVETWLKRQFPEQESYKIYLDFEDKSLMLFSHDHYDYALKQGILHFFNFNAIPVEYSPKQKADLVLKVQLRSEVMYSYERPIYSYKSYREREYQPSYGSKYSGGRYVYTTKTKQVYEGLETDYAMTPILKIELLSNNSGDTSSFSAPKLSFDWYDYFSYEARKNTNFKEDEKLYKRIWPWGIHKDFYIHQHIKHPFDY